MLEIHEHFFHLLNWRKPSHRIIPGGAEVTVTRPHPTDLGGLDPEERLLVFLGKNGDPVKFWEQAKTNLRAKKIRLLFVADVIPPELRRIVEFLNEVTDPVEILAVELRQYVGDGLKTLVPRVIGQTSEAQVKKGGIRSPGRQWDETSFLAQVERDKNCSPEFKLAALNDGKAMELFLEAMNWVVDEFTTTPDVVAEQHHEGG